jgi:enterochelin esterase-like enzyme
VHLEKFPSVYVDARNVDIWLPQGYNSLKKYEVLYAHDGQVLFDPNLGSMSNVEWGMDEMMGKLTKEGKTKDCIVVAVWNTGLGRHADYAPQKPVETVDHAITDALYQEYGNNPSDLFYKRKARSDNYLKFLVKELKPYVDTHFSVYKDIKHTHIMGSSMGGLISLYAICESPKVFGSAACLSTHWPILFTMEHNPFPEAIFAYLKKNLPNPKSHRIYFDYGDATLDSMYPPLQKKADLLMKKCGYSVDNWSTRFFPGENHSEKAWRNRLDIPLLFLLSK